MLTVINGGRQRHDSARARNRQQRRLHVIDIENLAGASRASLASVTGVRAAYTDAIVMGAVDQVVIASSHASLLDTALGWPHARYRARSGPDGADLELLDVLWHENVASRFANVAIGSGDGAFADAAARLAAAGVWVTVVSRRRSLSLRLALAACEVIYLDARQPTTTAARHAGEAA